MTADRDLWTVSAHYVDHVLGVAKSFGVQRDVLLACIALSPERLQNGDQRIPLDYLFKLLKVAAEKCGTEDFGLYIGQRGTLKSFGLLLYLSMCCDTVEDSYRKLPRYRKVLYDIGETPVTETQDGFRVDWHPHSDSLTADRFFIDALFSTWISCSKLICSEPIAPHRVHLSYAEPSDRRCLEEAFGRDIRFSQPTNSLFFSRESFSVKMVNADETMYRHLTNQADVYLSQIKQTASFAQLAKEAMTRLLPQGQQQVDDLARHLNVSRRTLQRRLRDNGTNFQTLLCELRSELSLSYLHDPRLRIVEISLLLGYADQSVFAAAFRNWHGVSPSEFRNQLSG